MQQPTVGVRTHAGHARSCLALVAWVLLAGLAAPRAEAAAPPGQWWNAAYAERLNVVVTGRGTAAATQYSLAVTIDHARMVASGRSLASGNDVRVVYWNGGGWVELDRRLDDQSAWNNARTMLWFRTQAALGALATDDNYYIYFRNAAAGAPPSNWANVFLFYDDFNDGVFDAARWTCTAGACTEAGGTLNMGPGSLVRATAAYAFGTDTRFECFNRLTSALPPAGAYDHCGASSVNGWLGDHVVLWANTSNHNFETAVGGVQGTATYTNPAPTTYELYSMNREGSARARFFVDGAQVGVRTTLIPTSNLRMQLGNNSGENPGVRSDWVRARKYVAPEPQATARRESTTLGGSCMVLTDVGGGTDVARRVALQSDGKIVVGGDGYVDWAEDFAAVRYNGDFRIDTGFGGAGIATTDVDYDDEAWGVAIQPDGKIVLGGQDRIGVAWADDDYAVVRYNADGTLDTATFNPAGAFGYQPNRAGMVTTQVGTLWDLGRPMVLQADGKIVVGGAVRVGGGGGQYDFGVVRYNTDGSLDTATFGGGTGKVVTPLGTGNDWGNDLVIQPDGKIILVGGSVNASIDVGLVRYNANGTLDGSFGAGGKVMTDLRGAEDWGAAVVRQPDGKIIVAGHSSNGANTDFALVRYNGADGSLDTSFGSGGKVYTAIGPGDDKGQAAALQPDGKIVVAGFAQNGSNTDFAVVRYNPDGSLDTTFGFGGTLTTPVGAGDDAASGVVLQSDGRIVVVGQSYNTLTQDYDFAMVRYNPDGSLDNTCGQVFYSIGTNGANLATGSPSLTLTSGTATLSAAQTNNVGVGDVIDYGSGQVFISTVVSPTQFRVQSATGNLPVDFSGPVSSITRAFNSISSAVAGSVNASHLNTSNLVTLQKGLTWVCYDDGPLNISSTTTIGGYTTNAQQFITLTVAAANQVSTGIGQRHQGIAGTGTVVEAGSIGGGAPVFDVAQAYTRFEWLEIDGNSIVSQDGVYVSGSNSILRHLIVHDIGANDPANCANGSNGCSGVIIAGSTSSVQVRNSFIYDYGQDGIDAGGTGTIIANTTIFRTRQTGEGLQVTGGTVTAENVLSIGNFADFCAQDFCSGTLTANNNVSSDNSADNFGGVGNLINRAAAAQFVSLVGPVNLHLRGGADAIDAGKNLAAAFNDDIDANPRFLGAAWDVGADESLLSGARTYYRSIGTRANLVNQGTITVTAGSATVTKVGGLGWRAENRGRGDVLIVGPNTYVIASVVSDNLLTLASLPTVGFVGAAYTIARQFATLAAWEACVDGQGGSPPPAAPCFYFPAPTASLVVDDRSEVGIAYDDGGRGLRGRPHDRRLGHRCHPHHHAHRRRGQPPLRSPGPGRPHQQWRPARLPAVVVLDDFVTVEWMEITGGGGSADGIRTNLLSAGAGSLVTLRNNLIHNVTGDGFALLGADGRVDVYNNISYGNSTGLWIDSGSLVAGSRIRILNNTFYGNQGGVFKAQRSVGRDRPASQQHLGLQQPAPDYNCDPVDSVDPASGNNLDEDNSGGTGAGTHNPAGGRVTSTVAGLLFVNAAGGNLHIGAGSTAGDVGADLSAVFRPDIDARGAQAAWDIGADESDGTTAVKLQSFDGARRATPRCSLEWRTASELDNLGFHVYRALSANGPWTRLNASLIPGLGSSAVGQGVLVPRLAASRTARATSTASTTWTRRRRRRRTGRSRRCRGRVAGDGGARRAATAPGKQERRRPRAARTGCCRRTGPRRAPTPRRPRCAARATAIPRRSRSASLSRDARSATLELRTGGFYALHEPAGTVRVFVPGFDFPQDEQGGGAADPPRARGRGRGPAGPARRACARSSSLSFRGLVPSALGKAEMQVGQDGTVRAARARRRAGRRERFPKRELVTLLPSLFQGETKSAVVEIAPLRFDAQRQQLVLAKRVRVRLLFTGREAGESGRGSLGRAPRSRQAAASGEVLARLYTTSRGLHAVALRAALPGPAARPRGVASCGSSGRARRWPSTSSPRPAPSAPAAGSTSTPSGPRPRPTSRPRWPTSSSARATACGCRCSPRRPARTRVATPPVVSRSFETNRFYQPGLLEAPDPWLWEALASGATRVKTFSLAGVVGAPARAELDVFLQGASESGQPVDHHVSVSRERRARGRGAVRGQAAVPDEPRACRRRCCARERTSSRSRTWPTRASRRSCSSTASASRTRRRVAREPARSRATWARAGRPPSRVSRRRGRCVDVTAAPARRRWLSGLSGLGRQRCASAPRPGAATWSRLGSRSAPRVAAPEPSTLRASDEPGRLPADRPAGVPGGRRAARRSAGRTRASAARAVAFEEIADGVRARAALGRGDPELPRLRLPLLGAALAALRAAARRRELRPAQLHGHVPALAAAGAVDEDHVPVDRLRPAARRGQRRGRAARPRDRPAAGHDARAGRDARRRSSSPGRTRARASRGRRARRRQPRPRRRLRGRRRGHRPELPRRPRAAAAAAAASSAPRRGPAILDALDSGLSYLELRRPRRSGGVGERERLELVGRGEPAGAVAAAAAA